MSKPFYEEIECEHGWTNERRWDICDLGCGFGYVPQSYCNKDDCPIYEEDDSFGDKSTAIVSTDKGKL